MNLLCLLLPVCMLIGCAVSHGVRLPKFSYNNKYHNSLIINRVPEYGDGRRDGCLIEPEMYLSLKSANRKNFEGEIKDVRSQQPVSYAFIQINITDSFVQMQSDVNGHFSFIRQSDISKLKVSAIGYRTLTLDFTHSRIL